MTTRVPLTQISSVSWEHPADRAALNTLRAIPGFDEVVRKVAGFFGERGVRNLFLGDAVRVGPTQRPALYELYQEVLESLDWPNAGREQPQLYVTQTPIVNASAVGFDEPFIVINSGMLLVLNREEQRFILAHEVGHIMSGHTTYSTIAILLLAFGARALPILATIALMPFQLALLEWHRKSELTADRAGLLGSQDPRASMMSFLKLAGGAESGDTIDLDAYLAQAAEYESGGSGWDSVFKVLNTALREHPFHTVRVGELQRWVQSGGYATVIAGEYVRRGEENARPLGADVKEAGDYYAAQARAAVDSVGDVINRAADAFRDAFRTASAATGMGGPPPRTDSDAPGSV
ncbi:MAG: M48 family metallopeptidase [Gemmatimonadota bacterium]|nr:M48 family metallopeptidase [Gemmatimonadota bacterium]